MNFSYALKTQAPLPEEVHPPPPSPHPRALFIEIGMIFKDDSCPVLKDASLQRQKISLLVLYIKRSWKYPVLASIEIHPFTRVVFRGGDPKVLSQNTFKTSIIIYYWMRLSRF